MLIAHFYPNSFHARFERYVTRHSFLHNRCTSDVDLIYCASVSQLGKAIVAKEIYKKPIICWVWDLPYCWREWTRNEAEIREHVFRDAHVKDIVAKLRKCDKVVSASKYTQRVLRSIFGIESEQIYFYINTEVIDDIPIGNLTGHVIQISRFVLNKRFDISIRAIKGLERKLVCVGGAKVDRYRRLAEELDANVDFYHKATNEVTIGLLRGAEVLVSPSIFEGWGITPIEALYCRIPVLLGELDVFREIYGDCVPYHKRDDPDDMREKLRSLLADKQLQRKIVEDCQPLISDFTPSKFASRWERMIG